MPVVYRTVTRAACGCPPPPTLRAMSPVAGTTSTNGRSVWADTFPEHERIAFPALERDLDVDVAIVGGGLTGLWTALHLLQRDPACGWPWSSATPSGSAPAGATVDGARRCCR